MAEPPPCTRWSLKKQYLAGLLADRIRGFTSMRQRPLASVLEVSIKHGMAAYYSLCFMKTAAQKICKIPALFCPTQKQSTSIAQPWQEQNQETPWRMTAAEVWDAARIPDHPISPYPRHVDMVLLG